MRATGRLAALAWRPMNIRLPVFGLAMGAATALQAAELKVVDYFAGKDELCLGADLSDLTVTLKRLILVVDIYGPDDRETHCTLVTVVPMMEQDSERSFSASAERCRLILDRQPAGKIRIGIVGNHVCELAIPKATDPGQ